MSIIKIDPEKVKDNPYQPRSSYSQTTIAEIAHSIEQIGIIHVPSGRQVDGHYELAEGHLRKRAFIKLKKKDPKKFAEMPLEVKEISDRDMAIIALEENLRRQDITPLDQARAIDLYLVNFTDVTETALAKTLNMTQGNIGNMRRVLKCPDEVLQKILDGKINFTMCRELLIFQGINVGFEQVYRAGKPVQVPKDEKWLMLAAVRGVSSQYGRPATVDGIKRAMYDVAQSNLKHLEKGGYGRDREPLFDTRAAGCLKCDKMIRCFETKTKTKHYCTDFDCWDEKQAAHKTKQEAKAKKMAEEDRAKQIAETEAAVVVEQEVGRRIASVPAPVSEEAGAESITQEIPSFATLEEVCQGCTNKKTCDGTGRTGISTDEGGQYICEDRVTKENYQAVRDQAQMKDVPESMQELAKKQQGTRAQLLDLRELRLGSYRDELKAGHAMLDGHFWEQGSGMMGGERQQLLKAIEDPEECTERCTDGFHYAYDSDKLDGEVHFVCSKPKCLTRKKAAFTRAKNAAGTAKKKAELLAIRQAVDETETIDKPRLLLIMEAQLQGSHVARGYGGQHFEWLAKRLKVEKDGSGTSRQALILKKLPGLPEGELRELVVEFCLVTLCYQGDIKGYKVQTTEQLNRMGIGVQKEKKGDRTKR